MRVVHLPESVPVDQVIATDSDLLRTLQPFERSLFLSGPGRITHVGVIERLGARFFVRGFYGDAIELTTPITSLDGLVKELIRLAKTLPYPRPIPPKAKKGWDIRKANTDHGLAILTYPIWI